MQAADLDLCARLERRTEHRCAVCTSRCACHAHARQVRSRVRVLGQSLGRRYMEAAHRTGLKGLARPGDTFFQELRLPALDTRELPAHTEGRDETSRRRSAGPAGDAGVVLRAVAAWLSRGLRHTKKAPRKNAPPQL